MRTKTSTIIFNKLGKEFLCFKKINKDVNYFCLSQLVSQSVSQLDNKSFKIICFRNIKIPQLDLVLQSEEGGDLSGFMPNGDLIIRNNKFAPNKTFKLISFGWGILGMMK